MTGMLAIVQERYGVDALRVARVPRPEPRAGRVLVRVRAAGIDAGTHHLVTGTPKLVRLFTGRNAPRQRVPGLAFAGVVETPAGGFVAGDRVFGTATGALAELAVADPRKLARVPDGLDLERAAALPVSAVTALEAVRDAARVRAGQRVLVLGAAGGVGSYAVQLAAGVGARVTAVCSGGKAEFARGMGAERVIDYTEQEPTELAERWDVIIDTAGNRPIRALRRVLAEDGALVIVGGEGGGEMLGGLERNLQAGFAGFGSRQRVRALVARDRVADLEHLAGLVGAGRLLVPIEAVRPLAETAEAVAHLGAGRARGKTVIALH